MTEAGTRRRHGRRQLTAAEAAERLGIKPATLYAYVSRGLLSSQRAPDGRASLFDAAQVERLALRGRRQARSGDERLAERSELVIASALTAITPAGHYYRGRDALGLARSHTFESVAEWLWTGGWGAGAEAAWTAPAEAVRAAAAAQAPLPAGTLPLDRLRVVVAAAAAVDPLRYDRRPEAVVATGRTLLATLAEAMPCAGGEPAAMAAAMAGAQWGADAEAAGATTTDDWAPRTVGRLAARLWPRLSRVEPTPGLLRALDGALVLLADHELSGSTVAARIAASLGADPYAVVTAGLGAVGGTLQAGATLGAEALFARIERPEEAPQALGELLRRRERVPGFGHGIYRAGDPRAPVLLDLVRAAVPDPARLAVPEAVLVAMRERALPPPNIDFALAALAAAAGMIRGAGEGIFAVARTAGWLAHAIEEYADQTWFRPRALYVGPDVTPPGAAPGG